VTINTKNSGVVGVDPVGTMQVSPTETYSYKLVATNNDAEVSKYCTVINMGQPDVEYRVSGVDEAYIITIAVYNGSTKQFTNVKLPWSYTMYASSGDFLYVSAQNDSKKGCITVSIYKDGKLFETDTDCDKYGIATAYGTY